MIAEACCMDQEVQERVRVTVRIVTERVCELVSDCKEKMVRLAQYNPSGNIRLKRHAVKLFSS